MAEAIAVIGLVAALSEFGDFASKVVKQLRNLEVDVAEGPVVFRNVRNRLPLMLDLVRKIKLQMDAGLVSDSSQELMLPVIRNCTYHASRLDNLINKALPQPEEIRMLALRDGNTFGNAKISTTAEHSSLAIAFG